VIVDAAKYAGLAPGPAAAVVFGLEVIGFLAAHVIALGVNFDKPAEPAHVPSAEPSAVQQPA
jgi:hypothetical protein